MGQNSTKVDGLSPVTRNSNGTVVASPDVCKTPSPGGLVPIPYPNIAKSGDLTGGSSSVTIDGAPVCVKDSSFATSTGDEAGTGGGMASSRVKGKAEPVGCSFDVKIEGRPVVRNTDLFLANDKNGPPAPVMQAQPAGLMATAKEQIEPCDFCKKPPHKYAEKAGTHLGSGPRLRKRMFKGKTFEAHKWYAGPRSLAAHHLICTEALKDGDWPTICLNFGYDINHKNNGVMLPHLMPLACQLRAPLHRGSHDAGMSSGLSYPKRVMTLVQRCLKRAFAGAYCDNPAHLLEDMDGISRFILNKVDSFFYTLTADGPDYQTMGCGCGDQTSLRKKKQPSCSKARLHGLKQARTGMVIGPKGSPLQIGE